MSINSVALVGRLTRDPEMRSTSTNKSVCEFSVAVNKRFKPTDGSPDADFFRVVAWGKTAEFVSEYLTKGRLVGIEGRLQSRKYTTSDGQSREVVEIVADSVHGLDRVRDDEEKPSGRKSAKPAQEELDEYDPFADE